MVRLLQSEIEKIIKEMSQTNHIKLKSIRDKRNNNNNIERLNGTIRDRIKTMRGLQNLETSDLMVSAFQNYYNFIRPHLAIKTTPAIASGLNVIGMEGNRWLNLLMSSIKHNGGNRK